MKSAKTPVVRKSANNTPNNLSGFTTRKNTQIGTSGFQKEDIVSPNKQTSNQNQQSNHNTQQSQNDLNQTNQQYTKSNTNANSRVEYNNNNNNGNGNHQNNNNNNNNKILEFPNSQTNIDEIQNANLQSQQSQQNQNQSQLSWQQQQQFQNQYLPYQSNKKILKSIRSEAKLQEVTQGNIQNIDFNYTIVDNLIAKRGFAQERMVPMELFQETMSYFEKRISGIEQRIEDNEQLVHLSDKLIELRNGGGINNGNNSNSLSAGKDNYSQYLLQQNNSTIAMSPSANQQNMNNYQQSNSQSWGRITQNNTDYMTSTFGSASTQKQQQNINYYNQGQNNNGQFSEVRGFNIDQQQQQQQQQTQQQLQQNNTILTDLSSKIIQIEKKLTQYDEQNKQLMIDIEKKFGDYSKKLNIQIEKFFKNAAQKMEQQNEKDQKLETISQQLEILNQTYVLKQEELVISNEEMNDNIKTISAHISKLENRINEHSIDLQDNKTLITGIEDDLFVMLQNYKDLSEGVQSYRNIYDEISYLKSNQANILKNINVSAIHFIKN